LIDRLMILQRALVTESYIVVSGSSLVCV